MTGGTQHGPGARPVAQLRAVSHRYGRAEALAGVSLEIPAGRMVGLIGPDGVGKSTLLSLIAGARRLQTGRVTVLGGDMGAAAHRARVCPQIAYMPQGLGRNLYPTLSVAENLHFFGRLFGHGKAERERRIAALLAATGMSPFRDRPAAKLSGGMKQKLGLCCALIHDPELLILDEPTTGVDPLSRRQFWELIARIRRDRPGMSVITATAYMEEAAGFDWLVAMDAGRVLATGTPAELLARSNAPDLDAAFVAQGFQQRNDCFLGRNINAGERFIKQDDLAFLRQCASEKNTLFLAAGKFADLALAIGLHADALQRLIDVCLVAGRWNAQEIHVAVAAHHHHIFDEDRKTPVNVFGLRHIGNRIALQRPAGRFSHDGNRPGSERHKAHNGLEQG